MKIKYCFILLYSVLGVLTNTVKGQSYLEIKDCKNIVVYYESSFSQGDGNQTLNYVLEKELIQLLIIHV